jgi:hypothetical protein
VLLAFGDALDIRLVNAIDLFLSDFFWWMISMNVSKYGA